MLLKQDIGLNQTSYYEASVKRPAPSMSLDHNLSVDVCVVGGGFAGLSTAIELRLKGYSVCLLEGKAIGWGASGRNGGQVIVGYANDDAVAAHLSISEAKQAWDVSVEGIRLIRDRIKRYSIHCDFQSGFLSVAMTQKKSRSLNQWIENNIKRFEYPHYSFVPTPELPSMIASERYVSGVYDSFSGHLHPLKYALGLAQTAKALGVQIYENTPVTQVKQGEPAIVSTDQADVHARFVVLAGNVYLNEFGHIISSSVGKRILPVGTYITATVPLGEHLAHQLIPSKAAICDNNFDLDYFRFSSDHRLLFGGDVTYGGNIPRDYEQRMRARMCLTFPQLKKVPIEFAWGGHVDVTMNRAPDFGRLSPNIYYLQGFSGHGVALTGVAGKLVAEAISGQAERFDIFTHIKHRPFLGGAWLRTPSMVLGMWYHRLLDKL